MRILEHVLDREIGHDIGMGERGEGEGDEQLPAARPARHRRIARVAALGAPQRHDELEERHGQREDQREMADLGDHWPSPSRHTPFSFKRSATSFGM